jgi:hypothetical protein
VVRHGVGPLSAQRMGVEPTFARNLFNVVQAVEYEQRRTDPRAEANT